LTNEPNGEQTEFTLGDVKCFLNVWMSDTGKPIRIALMMDTGAGPTTTGLVNAFASMVTVALQLGISPATIASAYVGEAFCPSGNTGNSLVPTASCMPNFVLRLMAKKFPDSEEIRPTKPGWRKALWGVP